MGKDSNIQWCDATWNVARGCTKVDEDCKFCYMYRDSFDSSRYDPLQVVRTKGVFKLPLTIKPNLDNPVKIFTSSLTDVFHPAIDSYRNEMWDIVRECPNHIFQILTKRPERIMQCLPVDFIGDEYDNVWLGTSIGSQKGEQRLIDLVKLRFNGIQNNLFASIEPIYEEVNIFKSYPTGKGEIEYGGLLNWVIVGGESGNDNGKYRYRPCRLEWIEKIVAQCKERNIPVFIKQLGTHLAKEMKLKDRHGRDINEFPKHLQIREFPKVIS